MNKYEIIKKIEKFAPTESAESWDCVGFMAETKRQDVSKIMLCLTPTDDVIAQARAKKCDMIISHHPLFMINCHSELVSESYSPSIDIYSAHTNLDKAQGGTTDTLIKTLGLSDFVVKSEEYLRYVEFEQPVEISEIIEKLRKISPNLRYVNNKKIAKLKRIAFCAGSGSEFIAESQTNGADALVTGDLKFHTALDSEIVVFDIGHFDSEILILPVLKNLIGNDVEVIFAEEKSPFIY